MSRSWTELFIEKNAGRVGGRVIAADAACSRDRMVVVKKVRDGNDRVVGRDRTDGKGMWKFGTRLKPGRYYATVAQIQIDIDEYTGVSCDSARTRAVKIRKMDRRWM